MASEAFKSFDMVSLILICVLGTIGNVLVVLVVYRKRKMKTVTNYFIVNLAMADLAVLLANVPLDLARRFAKSNWLYGRYMCKIIAPLQTMATTASVWSLVAISISRYVAIVHPLKPQLRRTHARWIILPVWAISLVLVSPYMASLHMKDGVCCEDFEAAGMVARYYTLGLFMAQYVVPLVIMAFAYLRVAQELMKNPNHDERNEVHYKETKKVLKMLVIVVFVFAILVLPLHVVQIWKDFFHGSSANIKYLDEIHSVTVLMLYGNSFVNPIIYNACSEEFRKCFRGYFSLWLKPCSRLVLGNRKVGSTEIFDDIVIAIPRAPKHIFFRGLLSRRGAFANGSPNVKTDNSEKHRLKSGQVDENYQNVDVIKKTRSRDITAVNSNCHVILLHTNNTTAVCSKDNGMQYVSAL